MLEALRAKLAIGLMPNWLAKQISPSGFAGAIVGGSGMNSTPLRSSQELLDAYNRLPWLRAVVHKVSHSVATTDWRLFAVRSRGDNKFIRMPKLQRGNFENRRKLMRELIRTKQAEVIEIEEHPLLNILHDGTEIFPGTSNFQLQQTYMDLVGEAVQLKEREGMTNERSSNGMVIGVVPIPPHWVRNLPTPTKPFFQIQFANSGRIENVPKEDVIYYRDPNPLDPYGRGSGTAGAVGDELQAGEAASRTIRHRLENNAIPPFVAMPDKEGGMSPKGEQLARLSEDWTRKLRGPSKTGNVHFLKTKFKFEKLGNTFEELNLIPLLKYERDTILQVYGVPPELFGIIENSNRATIDAAELLFSKHVIIPRVDSTRSVLQTSLVPDFDDRLVLDFESPVPGDKEHELNVIKSAPWAFMADEMRSRAGEEDLPDDMGKIFAVQSSLFLQDTLAPEEEDDEPEPEPEPDDDPVEDSTNGGNLVGDLGGSAGNKSSIRSKEGTKGIRRSGSVEKVSIEARLRRILAAVNPKDIDEATGVEFKNGVKQSGQRRIDLLDIEIDFNMNDPKVIQFLATESATQIVRINRTTRNALQKTLSEGFAAGESIGQLTNRVKSEFATASGRRALTIARTESVRAMNAGQVIATKQAGFEGKQWLSTRDGQVRDTHAVGTGMDGQIQPVDRDFVSPSGATGPWPGAMSLASDSILCRCTTLSIAKIPNEQSETVWPDNLDSEDKREQVWKADERNRRPIERALLRAYRRAFSKQEDKVLDVLRETDG